MAPLINRWTCCHTRGENKGANRPIMVQISDDKFTEATSFDRHHSVALHRRRGPLDLPFKGPKSS
jgi:hypothetical protein